MYNSYSTVYADILSIYNLAKALLPIEYVLWKDFFSRIMRMSCKQPLNFQHVAFHMKPFFSGAHQHRVRTLFENFDELGAPETLYSIVDICSHAKFFIPFPYLCCKFAVFSAM